MKQYILKRHVDRHAPGADVTGLYPVEELEKWVVDGLVRVVKVEEPLLEPVIALDDLAINPVEPVTAPVATTRKRK